MVTSYHWAEWNGHEHMNTIAKDAICMNCMSNMDMIHILH